jgi:large subunit ribosomal protein L54
MTSVDYIVCLLSAGGITSSKAGGKSATAGPPRLRLAPESDPEKLTRFLCGGNISREGGVDPALKPETEYPDWLWTLRTDRGPPSLDDLDPNSWQYWRQMRTMNTKRRLSSLRDRFKYRRF